MSSIDEKPRRPTYWRSLAELEDRPEFREFVEREFAAPLEQAPPNSPARRRFMQLMGASFALAGVASGCRWKEEKVVPFARRPEGMVPGETRSYATAMDLGGAAVGLHVTSYDGRPIKVEGNPRHPASLGACTAFHQASVLELYDPDRSREVVSAEGGKRSPSTWRKFENFARKHFAPIKAAGGASLRVLAEASSSPTLRDMKQRLLEAYPNAKWVEYEAVSTDNARSGSRIAFGQPFRTVYDLAKADVVLSLDADVIGPAHPMGVANARALASRRVPEKGKMSRIYAIESTYTLTGSMADHRVALRAEQIKAVVAALDAAISAKANPLPELGQAQAKPAAAFLDDPKLKKFLDVVAKDLLAATGKSLVVVGDHQPAEVHALVHRLNALLGNSGQTLRYLPDPDAARPSHLDALRALTDEMKAGQVDTLVMLGGNPVYTAPADLAFADALKKVKTTIRLGLYDDETSQHALWHLPMAHYLEQWGDAQSWDGTVSIVQPLIAPLWEGRSAIEVLAVLSYDTATSGLELVRRTYQTKLQSARSWRRALEAGTVEGSAPEAETPDLKPIDKLSFDERELQAGAENGQLEVVFGPDAKVYDGRFANNGWLQELPDPLTKLTWDNALLIAPKTARAIGIADGEAVHLEVGGKKARILAMYAPGQAPGSLRVSLGYGRTAAGKVGGHADSDIAPVGANAYTLRSTEHFHVAGGAKLTATGVKDRLPTTQDMHAIDALGTEGTQSRLPMLVREGSVEEYEKHPEFAQHAVHHPPLLNLWVPPVSYEGHKWGMSVDLNKCMGCNACMTACQAENNVPIVGREQVTMGRDMHWLRIDRYYKGDENEPEVSFQPLTCQQCENAPCEQVCPVGATLHSSEGLNDMSYNRCIGTRYCANNCPYKVRRFNYFNYHLDVVGITPWNERNDAEAKVKTMVFNPEVSVRARGVMEKCTYCVQRIQKAKIEAKNAREPVPDGAILAACQQTCPTQAIVFGDLNDPKSEVTAQHAIPRAYALLGELNNRPRNRFLARIRNPHPELV